MGEAPRETALTKAHAAIVKTAALVPTLPVAA